MILVGQLSAVTLADEPTSLTPLAAIQAALNTNPERAHKLAKQQAFALAGNPRYDMLAARAAFDAKDYNDAILALRRVLVRNPDNDGARLRLAVSQYELQQWSDAEQEFARLLDKSTLSPQYVTLCQQYLKRIDAQREGSNVQRSGSVVLATIYDSNVTSGIEQDQIFLPALNANLNLTEGQADEDAALDLSASYQQRYTLTQRSAWYWGGSYTQRAHNTHSEFDRQVGFVNLGYQRELEVGVLSVSAFTQPMTLDGSFYRSTLGGSASLRGNFSRAWSWSGSVSVGQVDNRANDLQSNDYYSVAAGLGYLGAGYTQVQVSYRDETADKAAGDVFASDETRISVSHSRRLNAKWLLSVSAYSAQSSFHAQNLIYQRVRDEDSLGANLQLRYKVSAHWQWHGTLNWSDRDSNIELYTYDRTQATIALTRTF